MPGKFGEASKRILRVSDAERKEALAVRRRIVEDEERAALEHLGAPVVTSDQRLGVPCPHGAKDWTYCPNCSEAADRDG